MGLNTVGRAALVVLLAWGSGAWGLDQVTFRRDGQEQSLAGRVLVTDRDGAVLLQTSDGTLWSIPAAEVVSRSNDDEPFVPWTSAEAGKQLVAELPPGFEVLQTQNYVIVFNTSRAYAQWCGALFEQLSRSFTNYWRQRGFELRKPEFPLVALVFADKASYVRYAQPEAGAAADAIIGYYSMQTNRVTTYDLTGIEAARRPGDRPTTSAQITEMLNRPESERAIATIVHEATHQLAFNSGLQARYADVPLWVSEGMAIFFETPDLKSATGWGNLGSVNRVRLVGFRDYLKRRPGNSLKTLLSDDQRLRNTRDGLDAYAEAWALSYFLIKARPRQYQAYFKILGGKTPWVADTPEQRLADFQTAFGDDLERLDREFLRYMATVR